AAAAQNWALRQNTLAERVLCTIAGLLLVFPSLLEAVAETISGYDVPHPAPFGLALAALLLLKQLRSISSSAVANKAAAKRNGGGELVASQSGNADTCEHRDRNNACRRCSGTAKNHCHRHRRHRRRLLSAWRRARECHLEESAGISGHCGGHRRIGR